MNIDNYTARDIMAVLPSKARRLMQSTRFTPENIINGEELPKSHGEQLRELWSTRRYAHGSIIKLPVQIAAVFETRVEPVYLKQIMHFHELAVTDYIHSIRVSKAREEGKDGPTHLYVEFKITQGDANGDFENDYSCSLLVEERQETEKRLRGLVSVLIDQFLTTTALSQTVFHHDSVSGKKKPVVEIKDIEEILFDELLNRPKVAVTLSPSRITVSTPGNSVKTMKLYQRFIARWRDNVETTDNQE